MNNPTNIPTLNCIKESYKRYKDGCERVFEPVHDYIKMLCEYLRKHHRVNNPDINFDISSIGYPYARSLPNAILYDYLVNKHLDLSFEYMLDFINEFKKDIDFNKYITWGQGNNGTLFHSVCVFDGTLAKRILEIGCIADPNLHVRKPNLRWWCKEDRSNALDYALDTCHIELIDYLVNVCGMKVKYRHLVAIMNITGDYMSDIYASKNKKHYKINADDLFDYIWERCNDSERYLKQMLNEEEIYDLVSLFHHACRHYSQLGGKLLPYKLLERIPTGHDIYTNLYQHMTLLESYILTFKNKQFLHDLHPAKGSFLKTIDIPFIECLVRKGVDTNNCLLFNVLSFRDYIVTKETERGGVTDIYSREIITNLLDICFRNGCTVASYENINDTHEALYKKWYADKSRIFMIYMRLLPDTIPVDIKKQIILQATDMKCGIIQGF